MGALRAPELEEVVDLLAVLRVLASLLGDVGSADFAVAGDGAVGADALLANADCADAAVGLAAEDVLLLVGVWRVGEDGRSEAVLGVDVVHLDLLVLHVVNEHLLVRAHVLHNQVVCSLRQVPAGPVPVGRGGSWLRSRRLLRVLRRID